MWTAAREALICDIVNFYNLTPCVNLFHHPIKRRRIEFATHILIQRSLQQTQAGMISFVTRRKWRRNFEGKFYDHFLMAFSFYLLFCSCIMSYCVANESQLNILSHTLFHKHQADIVLFFRHTSVPSFIQKAFLCVQLVLTEKIWLWLDKMW